MEHVLSVAKPFDFSLEEGSEEGSPMSFAERRKAHNRARVTMTALGIVGVVVVTMVVVMAYQMSALNSQIDELRAQAHAPARSRPDYGAEAHSFIGGFSRHGHMLTEAGEIDAWSVGQECVCDCNGTSTGIFCVGGNSEHEFVMVASCERPLSLSVFFCASSLTQNVPRLQDRAG